MIKNIFKNNKRNILTGGVFILFGLIIIIYKNHNNSQLIKEGNFTIGKYVNSKVIKGGTLHYYIFKVKDKKYKKGQQTGNKGKKGKLYFVIFNPKNPTQSRLLMNIPVPDTIKEIPENGWKELPITHDEKMIRKGFR